MVATRVVFNTDTKLKNRAEKRAAAEGSDLKTILTESLSLYAEGTFDPDNFLTKADMRAIRLGLAQAKAGQIRTLEEVFGDLGI